MSEIEKAQAELRHSYRSASIGQLYAGALWLSSAAIWVLVGTGAGVLVLLIGGVFIYPVTALVSRLLGNPGRVSRDNPLREASVTIPIVGALGIPVAGAAALYDIDWFYPAFMVVMGAHYLPFSHLYGMRMFVPLGVGMWLLGLSIALWVPEAAAAGGAISGVSLVVVGIRAAFYYQQEFGGGSKDGDGLPVG